MSDETKIFSNAPFDPNQKNEMDTAEEQQPVDNTKLQRLKALLIAGLSAGAVGGGYLYWGKTRSDSEDIVDDPAPPPHADTAIPDSNLNAEEADSTSSENEIPTSTPIQDEPVAITAVHNANDIPVAMPVVYADAPVADSVVASMDFDEAFAAARAEVGAGGFFEWNNEFYNTYYKEEWDSMSPDAQEGYLASIIDHIDHSSDNPGVDAPEDTIPVTSPIEENMELLDSSMEEEDLDDSTVIIEAGEEPYSSFEGNPDMDNDADVADWL